MKFRTWSLVVAVTLVAVLAGPSQMAAQGNAKHHTHQYHHYQIVDPGTFGGANRDGYPGPSEGVNNRGVAVGGADTSIPDPTSFCFNGDCYISYGYKWEDGILLKLGALPGFNSSFATVVSNNGHVVGTSENGIIDPLTGGRALEAVSWEEDGSIIDMGSLGGNVGIALSVNNRREAVGVAQNTIPDPYAWFFAVPGATQSRAFRWTKSGGLQNLGTLGGADSIAAYINERGQISGYSFTDDTINPGTGLPTAHPFLWENGTMTDLGTLGGTLAGPFGFESVGDSITVAMSSARPTWRAM